MWKMYPRTMNVETAWHLRSTLSGPPKPQTRRTSPSSWHDIGASVTHPDGSTHRLVWGVAGFKDKYEGGTAE